MNLVKNLFSNFNTYLKSKGYIVLTLFDGDLVMDILKEIINIHLIELMKKVIK